MRPEDPQAVYIPPELPSQGPRRGPNGVLIAAVVAGTVTVTLIGAAVSVLVITRAVGKGPPVTYSEIWLDNRSPTRLSVEIDGKVESTLEPIGMAGAVSILRVPDGKPAFRVLDASGADVGPKTLRPPGSRVIYPVGGVAQYALVTVHYARPDTTVAADSAIPLPSDSERTVSQLPPSIPSMAVERGIDEPFPDHNSQPERLQVCRLIAGRIGCEGGPQALTSLEPITKPGAAE